MTTAESSTIVGAGVDRVDGPLKVTGAAPYPSDFSFPGLAHAALVQSTIAAGTISRIDTEDAEASPGVLTVVTHKNAPALADGPMTPLGPSPPTPFRDNRILHHGQHVAMVVAQTQEQATAAARSVRIEYQQSPRYSGSRTPTRSVLQNPWGLELQRGDVEAALASAEVVYDETFAIAAETNNPMGLFATVARWEANRLTVHDCDQWPVNVRQTLATVFDLPETDVRVLVPYLGGGFGAGLRAWPHVILTALAARLVGRPVKLVLTRPQMFTASATARSAATRAARGYNRRASWSRSITTGPPRWRSRTRASSRSRGPRDPYACPNVATRTDGQAEHLVPWLDARSRGGSGQLRTRIRDRRAGLRAGIDPIELRLANYAEVHPQSGLPWSSKALRECYRVGAERFGWARRDPRSARCATELAGRLRDRRRHLRVSPGPLPGPATSADGTADVRSAATDIGTGT